MLHHKVTKFQWNMLQMVGILFNPNQSLNHNGSLLV